MRRSYIAYTITNVSQLVLEDATPMVEWKFYLPSSHPNLVGVNTTNVFNFYIFCNLPNNSHGPREITRHCGTRGFRAAVPKIDEIIDILSKFISDIIKD